MNKNSPITASVHSKADHMKPSEPVGKLRQSFSRKFSGLDVFLYGAEAERHVAHREIYLTLTQGTEAQTAIKRISTEFRGEYVVVVINLDTEDNPISVTLRRSISSGFELYFTVNNDGRITVSNRFDVVLCALPPHERSVSEAAAIDHVLMRSVMGRETYCDRIERLLHGEETHIDLESGSIVRRQFQLIPRAERRGSVMEYVNRLDHALESTLAGNTVNSSSPAALLFSGGVDSSLIASYGSDLTLLHCRIDSCEFDRETVYARRTAGLLGRPLVEACVGEVDYLSAVEDAVDRIGMPPHHAMTALLSAGFARPYHRFVCGSDADTLLGFGNGLLLRSAMLAGRSWAQPLMSLALRLAPDRQRKALQTVSKVAAMFRHQVGHPCGLALGVKTQANLVAARRFFGPDKVDARLQARIDYLRTLGVSVPETSRDPIDHLAIRHLLGYFTNNSFAIWRHLATSYGKSLVSPFTDARLLEVASLIPNSDRYIRGMETKYLLKRLLVQRLPGYPRELPKLGGVLPLQRYFEHGVLGSYRERYSLPEFVEGVDLSDLGKERHQVLWHIVSFAIWLHRSRSWTGEPMVSAMAAKAARYVSPAADRRA